MLLINKYSIMAVLQYISLKTYLIAKSIGEIIEAASIEHIPI